MFFSVWGNPDGREGGGSHEVTEGSLVGCERGWVAGPLNGSAGPGLRIIFYGEVSITRYILGDGDNTDREGEMAADCFPVWRGWYFACESC